MGGGFFAIEDAGDFDITVMIAGGRWPIVSAHAEAAVLGVQLIGGAALGLRESGGRSREDLAREAWEQPR
jgi:hypothetical protein